jgi:hypothetical protein
MEVANHCCSCAHTWQATFAGADTHCQKCGSLYVKWLNFEGLAADYRKRNPRGLAFGGPVEAH